jgi:hypothetical protein
LRGWFINTGGMLQVEIYGRVWRAVRVKGRSQRPVPGNLGYREVIAQVGGLAETETRSRLSYKGRLSWGGAGSSEGAGLPAR